MGEWVDLGRGGTYLVGLVVPRELELVIGRLGVCRFRPGAWVYVGSAHGPGGLGARLRRHVLGGARRHWHLDHLRADVEVAMVVARSCPERLECRWADWLAARGTAALPGFGASDCRCASHLVHVGPADTLGRISAAAASELAAAAVPLSQLRTAG